MAGRQLADQQRLPPFNLSEFRQNAHAAEIHEENQQIQQEVRAAADSDEIRAPC